MKFTAAIATTLTQAPLPIADLPEGDCYAIAAGQTLAIAQPPATVGDHWRLTLVEPLADRTTWYVLTAHGQYDDAVDEIDEAKGTKGDVGCGIFLAILGLLCLIIPLTQFLSTTDGARLRWLGWAGLFGGVPLTTIGIWYGTDTYLQRQQARQNHLKRNFYALIEAQNGEFSLLQYAKAADVSGQQARSYLDKRAKEFNATFEVDMEGGIIYRFK